MACNVVQQSKSDFQLACHSIEWLLFYYYGLEKWLYVAVPRHQYEYFLSVSRLKSILDSCASCININSISCPIRLDSHNFATHTKKHFLSPTTFSLSLDPRYYSTAIRACIAFPCADTTKFIFSILFWGASVFGELVHVCMTFAENHHILSWFLHLLQSRELFPGNRRPVGM